MNLTLAPASPEHAAPLFEAVRESVAELHRWMAWCSLAISRSDLEEWLGGQEAARSANQAHEFVVLGEDGELVGVCGLNQINQAYRIANLGYWTRSSRVGLGLATAAARELAAWAYERTDLNRLEIVAAVGNHASQRVAEKIGAVREGVLRQRLLIHGRFHDAVIYSLLRHEPAVA